MVTTVSSGKHRDSCHSDGHIVVVVTVRNLRTMVLEMNLGWFLVNCNKILLPS